jgi:hypothetical protein
MQLKTLAFVVALGPFAIGTPPAVAGLGGAFVDTVSYLDVSDPPPPPSSVPAAAPTPDCTKIACNILNYPIAGSSQDFPFPVVPATGALSYALDPLTETFVTVSDKQITITNNVTGLFCNTCTGPFSGFGFYFSSGVDITKVTASGPNDFLPVSGGLSWTPTSIIVNLQADNPAVGDELVLNIDFAGGGSGTPEPSTWAMMLAGFAGLGFAACRRTRVAARTA